MVSGVEVGSDGAARRRRGATAWEDAGDEWWHDIHDEEQVEGWRRKGRR
jgi:hypothetical protein